MKKKLTLSISQSIIPKMRRYARKRRTSVSKIVESFFENLKDNGDSFLKDWGAAFDVPEGTNDPRLGHLLKRHLKS